MENDAPEMPKNFIVRCHKCRWARMSTGLTADLTDLKELPSRAGSPRSYRCPACGRPAKLTRVKGGPA